MGRLGRVFRPSWGVLGRLGGVLGASLKRLGSILLESSISDRCMHRNHHFCCSRGVQKSSWGRLGSILSASWRLPGGLGEILKRLGSVLGLFGCSWTSLESSGTFQKHSKSVPGSSKRRSQTLQDASKMAPDGLRSVLGAFWKHIARKLDF